MKIGLLLSWPSADAPNGKFMSDWEQSVYDDLAKEVGFKPSKVVCAYPTYVRKWASLFADKQTLIEGAAEAAEKARQAFEGFDVVLTMGPHAMYVLTGETKIDVYRGTHVDSPFVPGLQVVPTYAPELFARTAWYERPFVSACMMKATQRYVDKERLVYVPETVADLYWYSTTQIKDAIAFDVETNKSCRITEFSAAASDGSCLYVQLEDRQCRPIWSEKDELDIWLWLHFLSIRRDLVWIFQNATYDLSYLDAYGIRPRGHIADTMLRQHAHQPEFEKSLGFMAALHLPTRAWKHLRTKPLHEFNKAGSV